MRTLLRPLLITLSLGILSAQLTPDQRVFDFQGISALYAKRYAPYDWKKQAFGFDLLDFKAWLDRVRAAKDDLEFFEIEAEYVASLNDTHSGFHMTSSFFATLGITVDIYDGKVLIDSINRTALLVADYPFAIGDELVSLDGKPRKSGSRCSPSGRPTVTRSHAPLRRGPITVRSQSLYPRVVEIGDNADVVIRRAGGDIGELLFRGRNQASP